jgi:hypothetical protein
LRIVCVTNDHGYDPLVVNTFRPFPHSWLITGFVTRLTQRVPLWDQEQLTFLEHGSSLQVFCGVHVTRSLVLCVMFFRLLFVLLSFFFWPLCCLSFFDLRLLITSLFSSNSSCSQRLWIILPSHLLTMCILYEGYTKRVPYALNYISLLLSFCPF